MKIIIHMFTLRASSRRNSYTVTVGCAVSLHYYRKEINYASISSYSREISPPYSRRVQKKYFFAHTFIRVFRYKLTAFKFQMYRNVRVRVRQIIIQLD